METAVKAACQAVVSGDGGPFGAVIVRGGEVIAVEHNMVLANKDPTCHAEMMAIRKACAALENSSLEGCTIYTSCYPCPMCMGASLWARLDAIYYAATTDQAAQYGFGDAALYEFLKDPKSKDSLTLEHINTETYIAPFKMWSEKGM